MTGLRASRVVDRLHQHKEGSIQHHDSELGVKRLPMFIRRSTIARNLGSKASTGAAAQRQLWGRQSLASNGGCGSVAALRRLDLIARMLPFELVGRTADARVEAVPASFCR